MIDLIGDWVAHLIVIAARAAVEGGMGEAGKDAYNAIKEKIAQWAGHDVPPNDKAAIAEVIDRRPEHDQELLRALLNVLIDNLPPVPSLELILIEPEEALCVLPQAVDAEAVLRERIDKVSDRMGLQSLDWIAGTITQHHANIEKEPNSLERYARDLRHWYKGVVDEAFSRHRKETNAVRSVTFGFQLANNGTLPAERVEIELSVTPASLVSVSRPDLDVDHSSEAAPIPPASLGLPAPKETKRPCITWYDLSSYRSKKSSPIFDEIRLLDLVDANGQKSLKGNLSHLQHGKAVGLHPFYVVFGEHPVEDIKIKYKIIAKNQRKASTGDLRIGVREQKSD
jgi:hypothetical protein